MQHNITELKNITQKPINNYESNAVGLMIVSPNSFDKFMIDDKKDSYLQIAITAGINAAKITNKIFPLCYNIPINGVNIEIKPSNTIHTDTLKYYASFIPSFKPKTFNINIIKSQQNQQIQKNSIKQEKQKKYEIQFQKAKIQFQKIQQNQIKKQSVYRTKYSEYCGFEVRATINTESKIKADMESLNAVNATLISLFGIFKDKDKDIIITQVKLET